MIRTKTGYVYSIECLTIQQDEEGRLKIDPGIFTTRKALSKCFGDEWGKAAKRIRITIKEEKRK